MRLRGGVIIIGSLLWDNADREEWRDHSLDPLETKIRVPLKIRYGRESGNKRRHTYTMIFSNHPTTASGQGYILGLKKNIQSKEILREEAIALAKAEELWTEKSPFLAKEWGAVGLVVNPKLKNADLIRSVWIKLFREHRCVQSPNIYNPMRFCIDQEPPPIDGEGFLQIDWTPEMDRFDFLIATPTAPNPRSPLTAAEIAQKMIQQNYRVYFDSNIAKGITTFQDYEILYYLNRFAESSATDK